MAWCPAGYTSKVGGYDNNNIIYLCSNFRSISSLSLCRPTKENPVSIITNTHFYSFAIDVRLSMKSKSLNAFKFQISYDFVVILIPHFHTCR